MFPSEAEVEATLAALRRQRDALDRQIADHALYLELGRRLRVGSPPAPKPDPEPEARPPEDIAAARRHGRALVAAAVEILHEAGRPLHAGEILPGLTARGFDLPGHDPVAALNTRLWKRSGPGGPLRRLGDAVYAPSEEDPA
jgi:hypothetical protein